jgi:hypothetical protein
MLLEAAARTRGLLSEPKPLRQKELGDFAVTYRINAYCDRPTEIERLYTDYMRISSMSSMSMVCRS